jgi:predicted dehydrogenase
MGRVHAQYINGCEGLELAAVCDVDEGKRAAAAADFPGIRTLADARQVLGPMT